MRVVIFGGLGFVGWETTKKLIANGIEVVCCDLPGMDICDHRKMMDFKFLPDDVVVNLAAAQYGSGEKDFYHTNLSGTGNILLSMFYGDCRKMICFSSDMALSAIGPYGDSKHWMEKICKSYRNVGFNTTILRPRLIIGPGRVGILGKLFWLVKHNLPVPMIGKGDKPYQMVSVFDCVQAIERAIERGCPNGEYNLGSLNPPPVRDLLERFIKDAGSKSVVVPTNTRMVKGTLNLLSSTGLSPIHREQYEMVDNQPAFDISNAEKDLGWKPEYSDQEMLLEAYQEWRKR